MANRKQRPIKPPKKAVPQQKMTVNNMDFEDVKEFTIFVAMEWDGNPPRMTWYDRLHKKGIWVRGGDAEEFKSPMARRASRDVHNHANGVVFQEGLYLVRNEDMAQELAYEAQQFGAVNIIHGRIFMNAFVVAEQDAEPLERYFKQSSKRGRKPVEQAGDYVVTCLDELLTYETKLDATPWACPTCNSRNFQARMGNAKTYPLPKWNKITDLWTYWLCSRFDAQGIFEMPIYEPAMGSIAAQPPTVPYVQMDEPIFCLPDEVKITHELQMRMWDASYSLSRYSEDDRVQGRLGVLAAYWNAGGQNTDYVMAIPDDCYDLIDMCILLRRDFSKYL
jgi:hypothetical protein